MISRGSLVYGFGGVFILRGLVFWKDIHRDSFGGGVGLQPKTLGLPSVKPRHRFPSFSINTHLSTGLAAPIGEHPGQGLNTFGLRLGQIVLFSRISLQVVQLKSLFGMPSDELLIAQSDGGARHEASILSARAVWLVPDDESFQQVLLSK